MIAHRIAIRDDGTRFGPGSWHSTRQQSHAVVIISNLSRACSDGQTRGLRKSLP